MQKILGNNVLKKKKSKELKLNTHHIFSLFFQVCHYLR